MAMVQDHLQYILEEQRHQAHIREADEHRRHKELRAERGHVSLWKRLARQFSQRNSMPRQEKTSHKTSASPCCEAAIGDPI
jgi:hypothetical protein